jgi:hypothetical protein
MMIAVFWVVTPCSLAEVYQRFRGPCCLHHQGDDSSARLHGATTQKTAIFILKTIVLSIALYGCETWCLTTRVLRRISRLKT